MIHHVDLSPLICLIRVCVPPCGPHVAVHRVQSDQSDSSQWSAHGTRHGWLVRGAAPWRSVQNSSKTASSKELKQYTFRIWLPCPQLPTLLFRKQALHWPKKTPEFSKHWPIQYISNIVLLLHVYFILSASISFNRKLWIWLIAVLPRRTLKKNFFIPKFRAHTV